MSSFVLDQIHSIDNRLDRQQVDGVSNNAHAWNDATATGRDAVSTALDPRLQHLQSLIKSISASSSTSATPATRGQLLQTLEEARLSNHCSTCRDYTNHYDDVIATEAAEEPSMEHELEWLLLGKAATQTYGLVLDTLIHQTVPISDELWYWNDVLSSYRLTGLYSLQTSPLRLYNWSRSVLHEVQQRRGAVMAEGWGQFYDLVKTVVRDRNVADMQKRVSTPLALIKKEVREKRTHLEQAKMQNASGIGYLLSNAFNDETLHASDYGSYKASTHRHKWKNSILKSISVIDAVLNAATKPQHEQDDFEAEVAAILHDDPFEEYHQPFNQNNVPDNLAIMLKPSEASSRLESLLRERLPSFQAHSTAAFDRGCRPSLIVRYWIPATLLLISSSTLLRYVANRREEILTWIRELGSTVIDFWYNWVIEPVKKVIGTIRHDENSEVSIMSKRSLEGDRASLERMVMDFARDNPPEGKAPLAPQQLEIIRKGIQEGDLTPVLRVYEKEMQSPIYNGVMGSLSRALLIQVQKTKVDVEVAMGGIDSLLKSQELVFGFVGLTPGLLVTFGVFRWLSSIPDSRRNSRRGRKQSQAYQILRNIDRILTSSPQPNAGFLDSREYGLLAVEAISLRDIAARNFPKQVFTQFKEDFADLLDRMSGVGRQIRVADRMRWAYSKWL